MTTSCPSVPAPPGVKNADESELRAIASPPEETHVYNVADFNVMSDIVDSLTKTICERVEVLYKQPRGLNRPHHVTCHVITAGLCCLSGFLCIWPNRRTRTGPPARFCISAPGPGDLRDHCSQFPGDVDAGAGPGGEVPRGVLPRQRRTARRKSTETTSFILNTVNISVMSVGLIWG